MELLIQINELYKSFGNNHVLRGFTMELARGECLAIMGKSGSGKSVLIKCIIGLMQADKGEIQVFGKRVAMMTEKELNAMRMRVGFLFQSNALYDSMNVQENLEFPIRRHRLKLGQKELTQRVEEALENVGLPGTNRLMPAELSGGMRKRIALARTLILRPEIILYDEPTTGLDPVTGKEISQLMRQVATLHKSSSIVISHDTHCVKIVASRMIMLIDGKAASIGTYEQISNSSNQTIKAFFE